MKFLNTLILISLVALMTVLGCKKDPDPVTGGNGGGNPEPPVTTGGVPIITPTGDEAFMNLDSDYVFDDNKLATYELILPDEALEFLDDDPAAEQYVEGSLVFEGDTISPVGIRYKGSIGAFVNCVSGNNWSNPSGFKTCTKLSMKIKINWNEAPYKFFGLKKLQFHSMNLDDSQMRDRLGYWFFREMGVPAPRCVHARLVINGKYNGLFSLVEQIDGRFTDYNYDDGDGNLYKEIWPLNSDGNAWSEQDYLSKLKTNEDDNPSAELIRNFAQEIENATTSNIKNVIANYMDIDEIMSYCVVDRVIRHDDGPFHWYCNGGNCEPHNFYWYEEPNEQKLHLIAWDMDNAFENITGGNPVTRIVDDWGETRNNCQPFVSGWFLFQQRSAACDPLTAGWSLYEDEYNQIKNEFKQGPLNVANANSMLDKWKAQVQEATIEANDLHDDAISLGQWESSFNQLVNQLEIARDN